MEDLQLTNNSLFDVWDRSGWKTITVDTVVFVDNSQNLILRHRPSLIEELPVDKCPEIQERLATLLEARSGKRTADSYLVSPLKKMPRGAPGQSTADCHSIETPSSDSLVMTIAPIPSPALRMTSVASVSKVHSHTGSSATELERELGPDILGSTKINTALVSGSDDDPDGMASISISKWKSNYDKIHELIDNENMTEATAFPVVFGFRYVKSTASQYKRIWKTAPEDFKAAFLKLGDTTNKAAWKHFRLALKKGKLPKYATAATLSTNLVDTASTASLANSIQPTLSGPNNTSSKSSTAASPNPLPESSSGGAIPNRQFLLPVESGPTHNLSPRREPFPVQLSPLLPNLSTIKNELVPVDIGILQVISDRKDNKVCDQSSKSSLCPFCDERLPDSPSTKLVQMLDGLKDVTWEEPTEENPSHRNAASFTVFISFCVQHRHESSELPHAFASGWPTDVDFSMLFDRVSRKYVELAAVIKNDANEFFASAKSFFGASGSIHSKNSIHSQFDRFDKFGAG